MTRIKLNTAAPNNSGARIEAGALVTVGIGPTEISEQRAKDMLASNLAVEANKPTPAKKTAAK